ncbi:MAG: hypothetical protein V5A33_02305 [Halobacteriales archaeon]
MSGLDHGELDDPEATFDAIQRRIARERRRTVDEREAFRRFERRVRELTPATAHTGPPAAAVVGGRSGAGLDDVRDAYRETVMSVPHYEETYDDTYERSVRAEFGPDVGAALTEAAAFDQRHKQAVLSAARTCRRERERLLELLDAERASVTAAAERLVPAADQLSAFATMDFTAEPSAALDGYRARLSVLAERWDDVAAARQADLDELGAEFRLPNDRDGVTAFLYGDFPATHPVLALAAETGTRASALRRAVERALNDPNSARAE